MSEVTTREPLPVVSGVKEDAQAHLEQEVKTAHITQEGKEHFHDDASADYPGTTQETRLHYKPVNVVSKTSELVTMVDNDQDTEIINPTEKQTAAPDVDQTVS